jgi:hypothetical protein
MEKIVKTHNVAKTVLCIVGIVLIMIYSISLAGGLLGLFSIMGKTTEEIVQILRIKPKIPKLIYFGAVSGIITAIIYIVAAVYLLRLRVWARKFLIWFIPCMIIFDMSYLFLIDMINKSTISSIVIDFIIWIILLNKNIEYIFKNNIAGKLVEK